MGEDTGSSLIIDTMAHRLKNLKKIIFCDTTTVILLTIVSIIDIIGKIQFLLISKN